MKKSIYLDFAATTPIDRQAFAAALPYYKNLFYNPSSAHTLGQCAAAAVEYARRQCAAAINASPQEIYFTSGGTESINWVFNAVAEKKIKHIIVSAIEHDAVTACAERLSESISVDYVRPTNDGIILPGVLNGLFNENTGFVSVMAVNNIVGSVQPIKQLARTAHEHKSLFFTDAVQAVNSIDIDVKDWDVDMLAVSGHKFYAPKGVGFLYVKNDVKLDPLMHGGNQERGLRAGTLDVPGIVAMGKAIEIANANRAEYSSHIHEIKETFLSELSFGTPIECPDRIDDIVTVIFDDGVRKINGGRLAVALSIAGVCCSVGSACSAGSATPPSTLTAMGVSNPNSAVRFSFGRTTTVEQAKRAAQIVNRVVGRL